MSAISSRDREEHVVMVLTYILSRGGEILPATVTNSEGRGEGTVQSILKERRDEYSVLAVSLYLELEKGL